MKFYTITRITGEPNWKSVPSLNVDEYLWNTKTDISMKAQICYDDNGLYVRMKCREKNIRAEYDEPLSMVFKDSCMEFFFSPLEGDDRYINFEINPNCRTFIGISTCRSNNTRICPYFEEEIFCKKSKRTADGWEVTYRIPLSFMTVFFPKLTLASGNVIRANCYKCGDLTVYPHYISWNPVGGNVPDFHRPSDFGTMILE